ncbi:MAG TPA: hypothetical protein DCG49_11305, partial [Ruminococcus sp.]|nr:hypothetical protein [Ruminococcus sp.]
MKKTTILLLTLVMTLSMSACGGKQDSSSLSESSLTTAQTEYNTAEPVQMQALSPTKLTNKMSENELRWVDRHALTLLDEYKIPSADPDAEHKVSIEFFTSDTAQWRKYMEENPDEFTEGEYNRAMRRIQKAEETGEPYRSPGFVLVDGYLTEFLIPYEDDFADGIPFSFTTTVSDENGEQKKEKLSFDTFEDYLEYVRERYVEWGYTDEETELLTMRVKIAYDALRNGDYETLPEGSVDTRNSSLSMETVLHDYRSDWEFDRDAVAEIKDSVDEIHIFDDELGKSFIVHVTLPPDYDKDKTYPVFFLTDGIWRFGNCPALRKCMENGEAAPVILVSLYYSYDFTDPDQWTRYEDLVINRTLLLDF